MPEKIVYASLPEYEADRIGYDRGLREGLRTAQLLGVTDFLIHELLAPSVLAKMRKAGLAPPFGTDKRFNARGKK